MEQHTRCLCALDSGCVCIYLFFAMRIRDTLLRASIPVATAVLLVSCASLYTSGIRTYRITGINAEARTNGYVFKIEAMQKIGKVEAWVGQSNWLYISIPDTSIDATKLSELKKCPVVSKMEFFRYGSSVQVTLQLNEKFDHVGVLSYPDDNNVYVVLYRFTEGL